MPGCDVCNASKKKCPGGVRGCLVEKERKEKREVAREEKMGGGEKKGGGPPPKVKSPVQTKAMPVETRHGQQPVTAGGQAATFTEILNAPRALPPDASVLKDWKEGSAAQALIDFPEGDQQPGACPECHMPMTRHYFGCSRYQPR